MADDQTSAATKQDLALIVEQILKKLENTERHMLFAMEQLRIDVTDMHTDKISQHDD